MDRAVEAFMDAWLDTNVAHKHSIKPNPVTIKKLAKKCVADARAQGISLDKLEDVVIDIEQAIDDELKFIATLKDNGA
jgi:hypothetical protein